MKQLTVSVTEEKYAFLVELLNSLDFISIDESPVIPEEHKNLVRERKAKATLDSLKNWDEVKHRFKIQ
jgi:hypothetical protein